MKKCRAYCTKEFVTEADRDLHEIMDHGAQPKCLGPWAVDNKTEHHHDSGVVHVHEGGRSIERWSRAGESPFDVHTRLLEKMETILESREGVALGGDTVVDQLLRWCEMLDEVVDKQRQELAGTDKAMARLNDRLSALENARGVAGDDTPEEVDPEHEHAILVLHQAEYRVREHLRTKGYPEIVIRGVLAAVRGPQVS